MLSGTGKPRVAVVREEGSNGDREMSVSLFMAGFEVQFKSFRQFPEEVMNNFSVFHSGLDRSLIFQAKL